VHVLIQKKNFFFLSIPKQKKKKGNDYRHPATLWNLADASHWLVLVWVDEANFRLFFKLKKISKFDSVKKRLFHKITWNMAQTT